MMRKFTLEQYIEMAERFNKMNFTEKIKTIKENNDIIILGSDGNWWNVQAVDKDIQEQLSDNDQIFDIKNEWGSREMEDLIGIIGINITDA